MKKNVKRLLYTSVLALSFPAICLAATPSFPDFGTNSGASPCFGWTFFRTHPGDQRHKQPVVSFGPDSWVQGYLSGARHSGFSARIGIDFDEDFLSAWMDRYCLSHAYERLDHAAPLLLLEIMKHPSAATKPAPMVHSCRDWIAYRTRPEKMHPKLPRFAPENWIDGYMSAANHYGFPMKFGVDFDLADLVYWMDLYCRARPVETIETAGAAMPVGITSRRPQSQIRPRN